MIREALISSIEYDLDKIPPRQEVPVEHSPYGLSVDELRQDPENGINERKISTVTQTDPGISGRGAYQRPYSIKVKKEFSFITVGKKLIAINRTKETTTDREDFGIETTKRNSGDTIETMSIFRLLTATRIAARAKRKSDRQRSRLKKEMAKINNSHG